MSFSDKGSAEEAEALVDSLSIDTSTLSEANLPGLSTTDYQTLNDLSQELTLHTVDADENEIIVESQEIIEHEEEVETEDICEEMEIKLEEQCISSPDDILPDIKVVKTTSVPPLRPLTIAPKPAKMPLTMKPVGGQQLLLLQGTGPGQAIKLVSPQGQELNLTNILSSRPVALKPAFKTITTQGGNISIVQHKPMVMKKILAPGQKTISKPLTTFSKQGQHFMVVQKADQQQLKLVQASTSNITMPGPTKTITLQQAQEMGLLSNAKIIQQTQVAPKQTVLLTKNQQKTLKIVPQVTATQLVTGNIATKTMSLNTIKAPTKILPATASIPKGPQRIILKAAGTNQTIIPSGQLIQVAGTQALSGGQLHQISIPGKGLQYIKFVTTNTSDATSTTTAASPVKTSVAASTANFVLSEIKPAMATTTTTSKIAPKPFKATLSTTAKTITQPQMVVIPTSFSQHPQPIAPMSKVAIPPNPSPRLTPSTKPPTPTVETPPTTSKEEVDANGMRPRKPCNCTKSQCLKLYCDCFANGEFCFMCNCMNCSNNLEKEEYRNRAIKTCLERNPHAFKPKIGKAKDVIGDQAIRKHTKGCNCKRSGCLKNYCECYEAKIACSNNCKCIGCRNIEDSMEKKTFRQLVNIERASNAAMLIEGKLTTNKDAQTRTRRSSSGRKQTINFITEDVVIEATCQCMLTISNNAEENLQDEEMTKRLIIEEFGRCLTEIIDCSSYRSPS